MAKLNFSLDGKSLGEFALDKERITIGRRPSNDIHIDNLAVSGEHAMILTMGNDSFLEDLNSTNGTMVNHKLIKKHVLQHNDVIEFGKYQLRYLSENQIKPKYSDGFANTLLLKPVPAQASVAATSTNAEITPKVESVFSHKGQDSAEPSVFIAEPLFAASENTLTMGNIRVLTGASAGHELPLNKALVKLGKQGGQLAVITKRPHGYFITHVEGDSHPVVNGQSIGVQACALSNHDVIELSGVKMEFYLV